MSCVDNCYVSISFIFLQELFLLRDNHIFGKEWASRPFIPGFRIRFLNLLYIGIQGQINLYMSWYFILLLKFCHLFWGFTLQNLQFLNRVKGKHSIFKKFWEMGVDFNNYFLSVLEETLSNPTCSHNASHERRRFNNNFIKRHLWFQSTSSEIYQLFTLTQRL